jgi:hypothetical protein
VLVADAETVGGPERHVVVDHVGGRHEFEREAHAVGLLEIDRDVALAALATHERPDETAAHAVAARGLDLDHVGAEVGQDHRTERARQVLAEVDNANAFEGTGH